jgi:16S rRNA (uracil1498-N3)-methyltransferase
LEHLSDIELYFTPAELIQGNELQLEGKEFHHSVNVMRNSVGDILFVTDGEGSIFKCKISKVNKTELSAQIIDHQQFEDKLINIWFCIPVLKNTDRLKFAFEKCVELGITNFILFTSRRSIPQKINPDKYRKTALAAMKQSLRTFLPNIISASFTEIADLSGNKIHFDQKSEKVFDGRMNLNELTYFIFGPEGGFDKLEIELVNPEKHFTLSSNRLRSETAIIKCASLLKF